MAAEIKVGLVSRQMRTIVDIRPLGVIPRRASLSIPGSSDNVEVDCSNPDATLLHIKHPEGLTREPTRVINEGTENVVFGDTRNGNQHLIIINHIPRNH